MKQIVLVDGKWLGYKMHFSHLNLRNSERKPTGMLHGFLLDILRIHKELPEAKIFICWDGKEKTWRHKLFPEYKGNRQPNSEFKRMEYQTSVLLQFLKKLGLWVLQLDDVEADDMIGMVAKRFSDLRYEVRIYSKDRDMYQLVDDYVWMWPDLKLAPLRRKDIEHWLGAPFEALTEIRAMAGDTGDNLKGLPGVGYKIAVKLWNKGFRITDPTNGALYAKYKNEWKRLLLEYRMAKIETDPSSKLWPVQTSKLLVDLLKRLKAKPERDGEWAERHRREIYRFFAEYELNQLMEERQKFFQLP